MVDGVSEAMRAIDGALDALEAADSWDSELAAMHQLARLVDNLRDGLVYAAHDSGYSTAAIGLALGMTKQNVHKRWITRRNAQRAGASRPVA